CQVCFGFLPWSEFWAALPMGPCSCSQPGLIRSRARSQLLSRPTDSHDSPDHHVAPKGKISDQSLIELFLDMVAAERGGGKNTLAAYASDLNDLSAALAARGRSIGGAQTDNLRHYLSALAARGFAASSVGRRLSSIRQLFRFLYREGYRGDDP